MIKNAFQTIEIRLDREWVDITTAIDGFALPSWGQESQVGSPTPDTLRFEILLNHTSLDLDKVLTQKKLEVRLKLSDSLVFGGVVDGWNYGTRHKAGDKITVTVVDYLAAAETEAPAVEDYRHYGDVINTLSTIGSLPTISSTHPRPDLDGCEIISHHPAIATKALAWWEPYLIYADGTTIRGYNPATGNDVVLANPTELGVSDDQITNIWLDGDTLYGVQTPGESGYGYLITADLTTTPSVVERGDPYMLYSMGQVRIRSAKRVMRTSVDGTTKYANVQVIGCASPEAEAAAGHIVGTWDLHALRRRLWYSTASGATTADLSNNPTYDGRNLLLPDTTDVSVEYLDDDKQEIAVKCYRMDSPTGYYPQDDLGIIRPDAMLVGELPLTLETGYYAFIAAGGLEEATDDQVWEVPSSFDIIFERPKRWAVAQSTGGDTLITAEDTVDISLLGEPLGMLGGEGDEWEHLYDRDYSAGTKTEITGFPGRSFGTLLGAGVATASVDAGLQGAYGRIEPLVETTIGTVEGGVYTELLRLSGWEDDLADNQYGHYHIEPTCITSSAKYIYIGVRESHLTYVDIAAPVVSAIVNWWSDDNIGSTVKLGGYYIDKFSAGEYLRLFPIGNRATEMYYNPLPHRISHVESELSEGSTVIRIEPALDCTAGVPIAQRRIYYYDSDFDSTYGIEEYNPVIGTDAGTGNPPPYPLDPPVLQRLLANRQVKNRFLRLNRLTGVVDELDSSETTVTTILAVDDYPEGNAGIVWLPESFATPISAQIGTTTTPYTVLNEDGKVGLVVAKKLVKQDITVTYSYFEGTEYDRALVKTGVEVDTESVYYTRGNRLYRDGVELEATHYAAEQTTTPLVEVGNKIMGVSDYPWQWADSFSGVVGGQDAGTIPGNLRELALSLNMIVWCEPSGAVRFAPREQGTVIQVDADQIINYTETGRWTAQKKRVEVNWAGGTVTAGTRELVTGDTMSITSEIITSEGWAQLLADRLQTLIETTRQATALVKWYRDDISLGDTVKLDMENGARTGVVSGIQLVTDNTIKATKLTVRLQ
ncbi:MAG: hypothetical protein GY832_30975 [Chloroflexi bacterium]|nr:hypothetical protein [Chloroflexota bacterium]